MKNQLQVKKTPGKYQGKNFQKPVGKIIEKKGRAGNPERITFLIIFITSFVLYANTLFLNYALDDRLMITENQFTKKGVSGIKDILTTDSFVGFFGKQKNLVAGGRYRPLSHVTFALEYQVYGLNPFMGHLINVLLYAFACMLVYKTLLMLFKNRKKKKRYLTLPFIATMLFVAHPLHTEVVANIKGRDEIMSLLGSFGALYFILKYIENSKKINLLWASVSFFLALLSKENAITFLALIPVSLYFFTGSSFRKGLIAISPLIFCSFLFLFLRYKVLGFLLGSSIESELLNNPFLYATPVQKFATIFLTWGKYLLLLVFPHPLTHDYYPKQIPIIEMSDIRAIIPMLLYFAMIVYVLFRFRKKDIIAYGILLFGITFSISSNIVFPIGTFMNERFMFIPLLGFSIIVAYLLTEKLPLVLSEEKHKVMLMLIVGLLLLGYSGKTIARNPVWADDYTLFTTDVKVSLNSAKCNVSAGGQTLEKAEKEKDQVVKAKMINDAIAFLQKGLKIHPTYTAGWLLMGKAMIDIENYSKSREYYETVLKMVPGQKEALNNWLYCAQMSNKNKDYDEAVVSYKKLMVYNPENMDLQLQLAGVYENKKQYDTVVTMMNALIAKDAQNAAAYSKLGEIYGKIYNQIDKSLGFLLKAYSISPSDASTLENIGIAYGIKKDYQKSIEFFIKSLEVRPENAQVYMNMGGTYINMGDKAKAQKCFEKAAEINSVK